MVKASLIIPAYNVAPYLETCLRSALAQTERDLEIIVVDDASSDATWSVIERHAALSTALRPIRLERNVGVSEARNIAIEAARGDWIVMLDSDDWMEPARVATLIGHAERLGADWIADDQFFVVDGTSVPRARLIAFEPPGARFIDATHIVECDPPEHLGYGLLKPVIRRDVLTRTGLRYRRDLRRYEDFLFIIDLAAAGAKLALLNEPYYWYRFRDNSLTKSDSISINVEMLRVSGLALDVARGAGLASLEQALLRRDHNIKRDLRYYQVVSPLKNRHWADALSGLLRDPAVSIELILRAAERLRFRLSRRDLFELLLLTHALPRNARHSRSA